MSGVSAAIRQERHAHPSHEIAHGIKAVYLPNLRSSVLALRSPQHPPAHAHWRETVPLSAVLLRSLPTRHDYPSPSHPHPQRRSRRRWQRLRLIFVFIFCCIIFLSIATISTYVAVFVGCVDVTFSHHHMCSFRVLKISLPRLPLD